MTRIGLSISYCACAMLGASAVLLAGCATKGSTTSSHAQNSTRISQKRLETPSADLVFASPEMMNMEMRSGGGGPNGQQPWEQARNDYHLGTPPSPDSGYASSVAILTRNWLWTTNGRPREYSSTYSVSLQQGAGR